MPTQLPSLLPLPHLRQSSSELAPPAVAGGACPRTHACGRLHLSRPPPPPTRFAPPPPRSKLGSLGHGASARAPELSAPIRSQLEHATPELTTLATAPAPICLCWLAHETERDAIQVGQVCPLNSRGFPLRETRPTCPGTKHARKRDRPIPSLMVLGTKHTLSTCNVQTLHLCVQLQVVNSITNRGII